MMQSDVITGKEVRSEEKVNTYFLKWTNVSEREKAIQEEKREAFLDFLTILVKKYGYKVLKKYGEVLQLVEKLFGLLPSDLSNLSTTELEEKLEELLKSRKKNETQMQFIFFQNRSI